MSGAMAVPVGAIGALVVKTTLVLALALILDGLLLGRRASASARHLVWLLAVCAVLVMPLLSWGLPAWRVLAVKPFVGASIAVVTPGLSPAGSSPVAANTVASPEIASPRSESPTAPRIDELVAAPSRTFTWPTSGSVIRALGIVYLAGLLLLFTRLLADRWQLRRLLRNASPVTDAWWRAELHSLTARQGISRTVSLWQSADATMPMTWGVRSHVLMLPNDADTWTVERRHAVLLHELAHVACHDCFTQLLAAIACALYWPHPGMWWAAHRLRVERELACDDQVLAGGVQPFAYARDLLAIAHSAYTRRSGTTLAVHMAAPSKLERRLRAAIDGSRSRKSPGRRMGIAATVVTAVLIVPVAAARGRSEQTRVIEPLRVLESSRSVDQTRDRSRSTEPLRATQPPRVVAASRKAETTAPESVQPPRVLAGGKWWIRPANAAEAPSGERLVHVMLDTRGINTFYLPFAKLRGPDGEALGNGVVSGFTLVRDQGVLAFSGALQDGRGSGTFVFQPNTMFGDSLERRGMSRPTDAQLFSLALHGVGFALLDELAANGYAQPTTDMLARVALTGVDVAFVREMAGLGYRLGTVNALVQLNNQGVDPAFVRVANTRASRRLTAAELLAMRMRGDGVAAPTPPTPQTAAPPAVVRSTTPVSGRWVLAPARGGFQFELQWDDDTQWRRTVRLEEFSGLERSTVASRDAQPVRFAMDQDAGRLAFDGRMQNGRGDGRFTFEVRRDFIGTLRGLGVTGLEDVSDHDLKNLAWGGISAAVVREFQGAGLASLSKESLVELGIRNVTPDYVRGLRGAGISDAVSADIFAELRFLGVPAEYAMELAAAGYRGLTSDQLIALRRSGVTGAVIRAFRAEGSGALSVDELIAKANQRRTPR